MEDAGRSYAGSRCSCDRCLYEASLPADAARALRRTFFAAEKRLDADPLSLKDWIKAAEETARAIDGITKMAQHKASTTLRNSSFVDVDVAVAQRLIALATKGSLAGDPGLCGRAANACIRAAEAISALDPLATYHVYFRHMALDMKLRLQKALGKSNTREAQAAAADLAVAWCSRHGCSLGWPADLSTKCLAAFRLRKAAGDLLGALEQALKGLTQGSPQMCQISARAVELWACVDAQLDSQRLRSTSRPAQSAKRAHESEQDRRIAQAPEMTRLPDGAQVRWLLPAGVDFQAVELDISPELLRISYGAKLGETWNLPWPKAVDVAAARASFSKRSGCLLVEVSNL
eukprot:TRINITY_DN40811_c0_g1_i1.p1 TRINITY_DN40811_c0_g1~~TRINITY_DN40811_c0_g1_i1.p1  ORF type:complete len:347 (-),score=75.48 TRINITY_DN40811_c0_g1_i1:90-1130(-)